MGEPPTPASDVYAIGALAWLGLTGAAPELPAERPELGSVVRDQPVRLVQLVERCLSADPGARPTAASVAVDLYDAAVAEPVQLGDRSDPAASITHRIRASARAAAPPEPPRRRRRLPFRWASRGPLRRPGSGAMVHRSSAQVDPSSARGAAVPTRPAPSSSRGAPASARTGRRPARSDRRPRAAGRRRGAGVAARPPERPAVSRCRRAAGGAPRGGPRRWRRRLGPRSRGLGAGSPRGGPPGRTDAGRRLHLGRRAGASCRRRRCRRARARRGGAALDRCARRRRPTSVPSCGPRHGPCSSASPTPGPGPTSSATCGCWRRSTSPAHRRGPHDQRVIRGAVSAGATYAGLRYVVRSAETTTADGDRATVRAQVDTSAHTVVGRDGDRTARAATAGRPVSVTLRWTAARVADPAVRPSATVLRPARRATARPPRRCPARR